MHASESSSSPGRLLPTGEADAPAGGPPRAEDAAAEAATIYLPAAPGPVVRVPRAEDHMGEAATIHLPAAPGPVVRALWRTLAPGGRLRPRGLSPNFVLAPERM